VIANQLSLIRSFLIDSAIRDLPKNAACEKNFRCVPIRFANARLKKFCARTQKNLRALFRARVASVQEILISPMYFQCSKLRHVDVRVCKTFRAHARAIVNARATMR
jgi:hypothetical protein